MLLDYTPPHFFRLADRRFIRESLLGFVPVVILAVIAFAVYFQGSTSHPPTVLGSSAIFTATPSASPTSPY